MKALNDGGGIDVVAVAKDTHQVGVDVRHLQFRRSMHFCRVLRICGNEK